MEHTFAERLAAGLREGGWKETDATSKYRVFVKAGKRGKFFIGPNGALRYGHTRSATSSVGTPQQQSATYTQILEAGERKLGVVGVQVANRLAALRAEHNLQPTTEVTADAATAEFDAVPCDTQPDPEIPGANDCVADKQGQECCYPDCNCVRSQS